jgi:hypothetical protein
MDSLDGFIGGGLEAGDAAVVIATPIHLMVLEGRLQARGIDLERARATDQYIALDAEQTLQQFMGATGPTRSVSRRRCAASSFGRGESHARSGRSARWSRSCGPAGHRDAVVRLEQLWHSFCQRTDDMALFCAVPQGRHRRGYIGAIVDIFRAHSAVVSGVAAAQTH